MKNTLNLREAAQFLEKSERTIRHWVSIGLLPVVGTRTRRIARETLEAIRRTLEEVRAALSYDQAADLLGVKPRTVREWASLGYLRKLRAPDGTVGVCREAVAAMLEAGQLREGETQAFAAHVRP